MKHFEIPDFYKSQIISRVKEIRKIKKSAQMPEPGPGQKEVAPQPWLQ